MKVIYLTLLLLFSSIAYAQDKTVKVDSLKRLAIDSLRKNFRNLYFSNPDKALETVNEAFPQFKDDPLVKAWRYHFRGTYYYNQRNADSSIVYYKKSLRESNFAADPELFNENHILLSQVYIAKRNFDKALLHLQTAENALNKANLPEPGLRINLYRALGNYFNDTFDSKNAISYYLKSLELLEANPGNERTTINVLVNLGEVFYKLRDYEKAASYFKRGLQYSQELNFDFGLHVCTVKFIDCLNLLDQSGTGDIKKLQEAESFFKSINALPYIVQSQNVIARIYVENKEYGKAEENFSKAMELSQVMRDSSGIMVLAGRLGDLNKKQDKLELASRYYRQSLDISTSLKDDLTTSQALENLSEIEAERGNFREALDYLKRYSSITDGLEMQQQEEAVRDLEAKYEAESKEKEITLLQAENRISEQKNTNQRNIILAGSGVAVLAFLTLFVLYRNRKKTAQKLKELDDIKSRFFANIAHEFRTPLTLISGPVEKQLQRKDLSVDDRQDIEMIGRNSDRLLLLANQLLELSKLESGKRRLHVSPGDASVLLKALAGTFQYKAKEDRIDFQIRVPKHLPGWYDSSTVEEIIINLLSNAFKNTEAFGTIILEASGIDDFLEIKVLNDGEIPGNNPIEKVFNRFYQADYKNDGAGIGLALVKELTELHRGKVFVRNTDDGQVEFKVLLAFSEAHFGKDETNMDSGRASTEKRKDIILDDSEGSEAVNDELPLLLIVEDNEDVRALIESAFSEGYKILEAVNGKEGIEMAVKFIPDIILSDIMMPEVDGLQLCETLKNDERTCHIPIILLTANAEEQAQYEGLEIGADDYLVKPFKIKLLESRVKNLINSRITLRNRYSQEVVLKPTEISITPLDEQFIGKVQAVLDTHLTDSEFSMEQFSELIGMSRMQLHRKLKALTGLSTSEFVRTQRLKLAASLLEQSEANVSEVCFMVGFNSPSYFTKCFKEAYNCLPSEFASR